MQGIIGIYEYRVCCLIGCQRAERVNEQELIVDIQVRADISSCVESDHIKDATDYVKFGEICTELGKKGKFHLIESYANAVLSRLFTEFKISWAKVKVKKPGAIPEASYSFIELERTC